MSEKHLTELPWKTLCIKQGVKDTGLQKALLAYSKLDAGKEPAKVLECLKEISELALKIKKANAAKEDVASYLDEVIKEIKKTTPVVEARVKPAGDKPAAKEEKKDTKESEEEEQQDEEEAAQYKKDLKKHMIGALAQVKMRAPGDPGQEKEPKPQLKFMAYLAGKSSSVIVALKVGASTKKLLPDIAGGASGGKYVLGQCIFEKNAHTFVVEQIVSGLAKKLAAALQAETGVIYKVRVRTADGSATLDSDTDMDPDASPTATEAKGKEEKTPEVKAPSIVVLQQTRLGWEKTRKLIQSELKKLEAAILASCTADESVGAEGVDITKLNGILTQLDNRLIDKLDEALNAQQPAERQRLNLQAKDIISEYLAFINNSALMADIDDSGFVPVAIRKSALNTLTLLAGKL